MDDLEAPSGAFRRQPFKFIALIRQLCSVQVKKSLSIDNDIHNTKGKSNCIHSKIMILMVGHVPVSI